MMAMVEQNGEPNQIEMAQTRFILFYFIFYYFQTEETNIW